MSYRSDENAETETVAEGGPRKRVTPTARRDVAPSVVLGRYQVIEELGHGGMGVVYRARDQQLGRDVALKLVLTSDDPGDVLAARLLREAQALAQLSHPNVVAVFDAGRAERGVFVAMELVSGVAGDAWVRTNPKWRDVLRVFREAGRGLAAAHAVGLVHRDFKPSNVILGSDGRVRVLDFGLARVAGAGAPSTPSDLSVGSDDDLPIDDDTQAATRKLPTSSSDSAPSLLGLSLTQVGSIVGTPPYMAPEQHLGEACDARTDQFSFCVSLYRALYGTRPFAGKTYGELKGNVTAGNVQPPPADSAVPSWVRDIVLRGLAVEPDKRWPSMDAIIDALGHDPDARRRKLLLLAAGGLLVAAAGGVTWWLVQRDPEAACRGGERELAEVWDATRKDRLRDAFTKTGKPFAEPAFATVARTLDDYGARWVKMRTDACVATNVRGTQSAELLDLRIECLQRRLDDVRALVDVFATADGDVVSRAAGAVGGLPPLAACADSEALRAPVRPPADAKTAARVLAAQRTLASVQASQAAGRYAEAQKQLEPLVGEARELGWRPLEGEVLLVKAQLAEATGAYADAAELFKDAAIAAESGRDDYTAALARNALVWVAGERLGRYPEAHELARFAEAKVERLGRNELLQADLDQKLAALLATQAKFDEAEQRAKRVLATREKLLAPDDARIAQALGDLGDVLAQASRYKEAISYYERALAVAERSVGTEHPMIASLRINLGSALRLEGKRDEAREQLERAKVITERALGAEHPQLATLAVNLGSLALEQERLEEASAQFTLASEMWTRVHGTKHPNVGTAQYRLGEVALARGRTEEATAAFQRALDIWEAKLGVDNPAVATALDGLGRAAIASKRKAEAIGYFRRTVAIFEKALGPDHEETVRARATLERTLGRAK